MKVLQIVAWRWPSMLAWPAYSAAPTQTARAPVVPDVPSIVFEKYTLPNGLEVILSPDHRLPMVAVNLWYHVGPANEAAGRTGFAHLFEHMMFQGAKHVPAGRPLPDAGGRRCERHQRHHRFRPHQLLRDAAREPARAGAVARGGPHGLPARRARPGEPVEPAGRGAQRTAPERREPAVRDRPGGARPTGSTRRDTRTTPT